MMRFLVGALVAIGRDELTLLDLQTALKPGLRPAFECAPARGLVLYNVHFDTPIEWQTATS